MCGLKISCAQYFTNYPFDVNFTTTYQTTIQATVGYNKIILEDPVMVRRGNLPVITQGGALLALDKTSFSSYSDLTLQSQAWIKLYDLSNWRFYMNVLTNFSSYYRLFSVVHQYQQIGQYQIAITFEGSDNPILDNFLITDCKHSQLLNN